MDVETYPRIIPIHLPSPVLQHRLQTVFCSKSAIKGGAVSYCGMPLAALASTGNSDFLNEDTRPSGIVKRYL